MDWTKLSFKYTKTNTVLTCMYQDGKWGEIKSQPSDSIQLAAFSPSLHYGMSCFEGLKAFNGVDGKVRVFRPQENASRFQSSAAFLGIPCPDEKLFMSMVMQAVAENRDFIPPYETRASLYVRPILVTTIPSINLVPQQDGIMFMVITLPVGVYGGAKLKAHSTVISRQFDRAAPHGSGAYKVGGNYACAMYSTVQAQKKGYGDVLFLNPGGYEFIDEFSSANFFGIKGNSYVTPLSPSVLPSVTNRSLEQIARDMGMDVQRRKVPVGELAEFDEVGECGTAVVINPVDRIDDRPAIDSDELIHRYDYCFPAGESCGATSRKLYEALTGIQYGEAADNHDWIVYL